MNKVKRKTSVYHFLTVTFLVSVLLMLVAAILFPMFAKARECARCTSCQSNLKQLGLGFIQYVEDYDEKWPGGADHWASAIYSYEKSSGVYHCPDDPVPYTYGPYLISYAANANLRGKSDAVLSEPASTVLATDFDGTPPCNFIDNYAPGIVRQDFSRYTTGVLPNKAWGGVALGSSAKSLCPARHNPGDYFLAADGHVRFLRPDKVSSGIDNPSASGSPDAVHAAGTKSVGAGKPWLLTFSEK